MKMRVNAALLLLLSLCTAPVRAMQVDDEQVTPEMWGAVDRFIANRELGWAAQAGEHKRLEQLLAEGADPNSTAPDYTSVKDCFKDYEAVSQARQNGYAEAYEILTRLLAKAKREQPLLVLAATPGHHKVARALLLHGAYPDCNDRKECALYRLWGCTAVVALLLRHGADPNRFPAPHPNDSFEVEYPSPLDFSLYWIHDDIHRNNTKLLLAHNARPHGPRFKDLPYHKLCARIWKAEDPDISDAEAHEKQRQFTLDHWNIRNPAQFIFDRKLGLVKKPRCKCHEVEV